MDDETRRLVDATMIGEAVESLALPVFVSDPSLHYLAVNAAAAELVGCTRAELLAKRVSDVAARSHRKLRQAALDAEASGFVTGDGAIRRDDGELLEVVYTTLAGRIGHLPVLVSFVRPKESAELEQVVAALRSAAAGTASS
ncbi:MAG TPA: PAS domain-containing protein [Gaiellaceae bacterium]|nr:PAS domain-containing protein [Gaiellaceae bacterium]